MLKYASSCLIVLSALALSACANITGTPCGGTRQVDAQLVLPDTGLGAGGQANLGLTESDPGRSFDETSLIVWTFPPTSTGFADAPPRVRVIADDGTVFLDLSSTSAYQGSWYAREPIAGGPLRDQIVSAFAAGQVVVEYSSATGPAKVTRVRPIVRFAGTTPVLRCL